MVTNEFVLAVQKMVSERAVRDCHGTNCPYIKAAVIEMMIPYIGPLAQVIEDKAQGYTNEGSESVHIFVADVVYEVMATMGKFIGTSVQTTMDVCNACAQAASIDKGERH